MIHQQGLVLDPEFIRIRDAGLLFISGNVSFIQLVWYPQNLLIYDINYFHKLNWNIRLLTNKPSEGQARTPCRSELSPDPGQLSANNFREC